MRTVELIQRKRDGEDFGRDEIEFFLQGTLKGEIPDYQASALLMAIYFTGLTDAEMVDWTQSMMALSPALDLSGVPGPKIDQHSTGGVGDKTSLIVGPLAAAAGVTVPTIAARGLSHTGGSLDKFQSIPGFNLKIGAKDFKAALQKNGIAVMAETEELNPAARKLAALRNDSATVESIPLIVSSLLSRKLVEGIDGLVLDVKTGSGALIKKMTDSRRLAQSLVNVAKRMNKKAISIISDMDQPLGNAIGNALEVMEAVESMRGNGPSDVVDLSLELAARMVCLAFPDRSLDAAKEEVFKLLNDGSALKKFRQLIEAQGGNPQIIDSFELLPNASADFVISSPRAGFVSRISADDIGQAVTLLGGGRDKPDAVIDYAVGIVLEHKVGDHVQAGERLCTIYYNDPTHLEEASQTVEDAFHISASAPEPRPLIYEVLQ
jgi:pyrimidine-nucleoside phosphorylase